MANLSLAETVCEDIESGKCEKEVRILFELLKTHGEDKRVRVGVLSFVAMNTEGVFDILI